MQDKKAIKTVRWNSIQYLAATMAIVCLCLQNSYSQIKAKIMPTRQQVYNFIGTYNVKLIFANGIDSAGRYLYYVDFSETSPSIHQIASTQGAWNLSISPDGKWVTYNIGNEGIPNNSTWFCQIAENAKPVLVTNGNAHEPRFFKRIDSVQILYTTTEQTGDWNGIGKTVFKNIVGTVPDAKESILYSGGSFHGGLSYDRRYLATTEFEPNPRMVDLSIDSVHTLHSLTCVNTVSGKDSVLNPQACNCSISSSHIFTNVMIYMDFGLPNNWIHPVLGTWGFHKRIFVGNSNGEIVRWYDFPDSLFPAARSNISQCVWTYSEWSVNHPYFGVAANITSRYFKIGQNYSGTNLCEDVYFMNLKSASYLKAVESTDTSLASTTCLQWPSLWVELPDSFMEDSTWLLAQSKIIDKKWHADFDAIGAIRIRGDVISSDSPIKRIKVYDTSGRLIREMAFHSSIKRLSVHGMFRSGPYIMKITTSREYLLRYISGR